MSFSRRTFGWSLAGLLAASAVPALARDPDDWPNVFIAPMGKPFRAKMGAPYPVADWFKQADKNSDGKLDHAEFMADAGAFFDYLDVNHDGALSSYEQNAYERVVAPEILGFNVDLSDRRGERTAPGHGEARLWLAQYGGANPMGNVPVNIGPAPPTTTDAPLEAVPDGAAPFSFLDIPEPLAAADVDFSGVILKANFLKLADRRFDKLDTDQAGYLTLAKLPKTYVQKKLEHATHRGLHF
jgi:EF hand